MNTILVEGEIEDEITTSFTRTLVEDSENNIYAAGRGFFGKIVNGAYGSSQYLSLMEKIPDSINPYNQVFWGGVNKGNSIYLYTRDLIFRYDGNSFDNVWKLSEREEGVDTYGTIQTLIKVDDRIFGTAASVAYGIINGANIIRVHDYSEMNDVRKMINVLEESRFSS